MEEYKRTLKPVVTGSSVIAFKYKDGIIMACDTKASYGNMCRYPSVLRVHPIGKNTMICGSGEYSDFQFIITFVNRIQTRDWIQDYNKHTLKTKEYASILGRLMYGRRSRFNPLWNSLVVAGYDGGEKPYLGYIDMYGTTYEEDYIATGFGRYFGLTLIRDRHRPDMSEDEARELIEECMRLLFYRDTLASNRIQISTATAYGIKIEEPYVIESKWDFEAMTRPTSLMPLAGCSW